MTKDEIEKLKEDLCNYMRQYRLHGQTVNHTACTVIIDYLAERGLLGGVPAWQPIETAPKDETEILILCRNMVYIVRWSEECEHGSLEKYPGWQLFVCDDGYYSIGFKYEEPTHWMPLPATPKHDGGYDE